MTTRRAQQHEHYENTGGTWRQDELRDLRLRSRRECHWKRLAHIEFLILPPIIGCVFFCASLIGSAKGARMLLDHDVNIEHTNITGRTALRVAGSCGRKTSK